MPPYPGAFWHDSFLDFQPSDGACGDLPELPGGHPDAAACLDGVAHGGFIPADPHQQVWRRGCGRCALFDDDSLGGESASAFRVDPVAHADEAVAETARQTTRAFLVRVEFLDDAAAPLRRVIGRGVGWLDKLQAAGVGSHAEPRMPHALPTGLFCHGCRSDWLIGAG